ncbi:MAG: hypothetical protein ABI878_07505 [Acidobacteriota bacterium]
MANVLGFIVLAAAVLGCNLSNQKPENSNSVDSTRPTPTATSSPSPTPTATPKPTIGATLKKSVGKYPYEIKLLDNAELKARLQKLMGKDFADMKQFWNVETPLEGSGKVLKASGCEQHNCGSNMYVLFIDLDTDNINVYHTGDQHNTYFEKGRIKLPPKYAADVEPESQEDEEDK